MTDIELRLGNVNTSPGHKHKTLTNLNFHLFS